MSRNADPVDLVQGRVIASKYRLEQPIGRGGMGVVFRATHLELSFNVAIKVLTSDVDSSESRDRFLREARAAAQIRSEHAARVFDLGSLPSGAPFIVMECLEGVNLRQYLRKQGKAPVDQAISFVIQACRAVAEAHALGIVHRDIKPSNLFLCERDNAPPVVKVLDFGISKTLGSAKPSSTTTGAALVGSPQYMSPERLRAHTNIDATVDVWAFGAVLYELLSGSPAFSGETVPALLASIVADEPAALTTLCPDVPRGVAEVVEKCLQKDPTKRYANALELLQALASHPVATSHATPARTAVDQPATNEHTKVQPGFSDTTLLLSPSDIELLSEPQPPTTTTIEPLTKDATARTHVKQTLRPQTNTQPWRARALVLAGLASAAVATAAILLRPQPTTRAPNEVLQQTEALQPGSGSGTQQLATVRPPATGAHAASITLLDQLPAAADLPAAASSPPAAESKLQLSSKSRRGNQREAVNQRGPSREREESFPTRPPSSAKKSKKSSGTELFSDIH